MIVDRGVSERVLDSPLRRQRPEGLGHLRDLRDEGEALDLGEALLEVPDELEHEARGVAHGVGDVAERDQPRLLAAPPAPAELDRPPAVRQARAERALHVELAPLLPPLPECERVLDPAREPGDDRLHLGDLVDREREERLVGQELPSKAIRLAMPPPRQLPLDVLTDQPPERLQPQVHVRAEPGERTRVHPLLLGGTQEGLEVRLDLLPRELVPDLAGEVADLEEVEEALESHPATPLPDRELERRGVGQEEHLRQRVDVQIVPLLQEALEQRPRPRILAPEGLGRLGPEALQVEEVEVEDPLEGREVTRLLDQGRGQRVPEVVQVPEADLWAARSASSASVVDTRTSARRSCR